MNMPPNRIAPSPGGSDEINLADMPLTTPLTTAQITEIAAAIDRHRSVSPKIERDEGAGAMRHAFVARRMLHILRVGNETLGGQLFSNPAWEILLDLFVNRSEGKRVTIVSLCITATAPAGTVLRYLNALTEAGLVIQADAEDDRPSPVVDLSADAFASMKAILD